jgi:uncharacterized protein (DUF1501 family)
MGTMLIPNFLKAFDLGYQRDFDGKILIVLQLSGGNDGLNTVIPFANDLYYEKRPRLAIPRDKVLKLTQEQGFNPAFLPMQKLYDQGVLSVLNSVGYPNPERSHFRSMDIWHTASDANEYWSSGWIGRILDSQCNPNCSPHKAIELDDSLGLALKGEKSNGLAMENPQKLYQLTQNKRLKALKQYNQSEYENVNYLYKTLAETVSSSDYIYEKSKIQVSKTLYPNSKFAQKLKQIAQMIGSGIETQVYYASLSGFDTHVNQANQQERLLKEYSEAVLAFVEDLKKLNRFDNTTVLTFSEFGRRVSQNASNGTDHGTANNVFVMNGKLKKQGFYNVAPNLSDLDNGDLKFQIDFRSVYATLLEKHLKIDSSKILDKKFSNLEFI